MRLYSDNSMPTRKAQVKIISFSSVEKFNMHRINCCSLQSLIAGNYGSKIVYKMIEYCGR